MSVRGLGSPAIALATDPPFSEYHFALNVDWQILEMAGSKRTIEVFYNFMIMDANMNVLWDP